MQLGDCGFEIFSGPDFDGVARASHRGSTPAP
jgi:hypothetical protein